MALLRASKLMSFSAFLAILALLISSILGTAAQPNIKLGRKLFQAKLPPTYVSYPGGGGYTPTPTNPGGGGYTPTPSNPGGGGYTPTPTKNR